MNNRILPDLKFSRTVCSNDLLTLDVGIPSPHPILSVVSPTLCRSPEHVEQYFHEMRAAEGIIVRNPSSWYYKENSFLKIEVKNIVHCNDCVARARHYFDESNRGNVQMVHDTIFNDQCSKTPAMQLFLNTAH